MDKEKTSGKSIIEVEEIMQMIPHRYPFLLIDRVKDIVLDTSAVGIKNVTMNEPFFQGHFPDHPIMPGVLLIEAMAHGVPCVSTNVGESKYIIGKFGSTVPINKPALLANSIDKNLKRMSNPNQRFNSRDIKKRINNKYSISKNIKKYQKLYEVLV